MFGKRTVFLYGLFIIVLVINKHARAETVEDLDISKSIDLETPVGSSTSFLSNGTFKFSTGFDYSSGKYGNIGETEIWYVPVSMGYQQKKWKAKISIPWVRITGPGGITGEGEVINPDTAKTTSVATESGLGDIVTSLSYSFNSFGVNLPLIDLTTKIKFPTANENKGLGSGEYDFTIQSDLYKPLGKLTLMGMLGYKFKGDPPGRDLNNVIKASVGASYKFNDQYSSGMFVDFQEATSQNTDDVIDLFTYLTWRMHKSITLTGYGAVGFTDGTPDKEIGLQIGYKK